MAGGEIAIYYDVKTMSNKYELKQRTG
ncbi:uncharacterized protein G2W53_004582 [Senna tora]|uniref:Uncharacterized protein n=1 Tax=Senna tora TaxID=362788 RepID=A0A834XDG2_9FABA|nr:uncharacterized protein G2W53_028754 [Senna tora]KAF7820611.1 uncharacterized protein G2W53_026066 [Senna tora]KAF7842282.1 uncharacterized protein G2W53_004580 [Senna tora]KAF7842284.1 uncharacterized protein G2W53_004582 [Senna tora]